MADGRSILRAGDPGAPHILAVVLWVLAVALQAIPVLMNARNTHC